MRLIRAGRNTPAWKNAIGRQFRIGYYSRKDGLDCIWLVNENGKYEQTTDREFLLKHFDVEYLTKEKNYYGVGKRRLARVITPTPLQRLNGRTSTEAYEGAKQLYGQQRATAVVKQVIDVLQHGQRVWNRAAAAYALNLTPGERTIRALEEVVANQREHPKVRGQAAESLACNHRAKSHDILRANLTDPSKQVRFWCAYSLAQMADEEALVSLKLLAEEDYRVVKGFWSVSKEAKWAIREIRNALAERHRRRRPCIFCSRARKR